MVNGYIYTKQTDMRKKSYPFSGCTTTDLGLPVPDIKTNVSFGDLSRSTDRVPWKKSVK